MEYHIRSLSFISAVIALLCAVTAISPCRAAGITEKSLLQYTSMNLTFEKPEDEEYECEVENNEEKYIKVDAYNEGEYYWLMVEGKKPTGESGGTKITVYKEENGKKLTVRSFRVTVLPCHKVRMEKVRINKGTGRLIELDNPYDKDYELRYNSKKIKLTHYLGDGDKVYYTLKGLRYGITRVRAYLEGTKELIGSFTVIVWNYRASVKPESEKAEISYNEHIDTRYLQGGTLDIGECIENYRAGAVYTVKAADKGLVGTESVDKTETTPKAQLVYGKRTGSTVLTVWEKRGKRKEKKIGTIDLTVIRAEDSEVFGSNMELDNDGIFYELFICPGESFDLKEAVRRRYIDNEATGSGFARDEYTFTVKADDPAVISADENGVCTCHSLGVGKVTYTVAFADGSSVTRSGTFDTVPEDEFDY